METKRALSWSAISQYVRCPEQYNRQRVLRIPTGPRSSALVEGSVGHAAIEYALRNKLAAKPVTTAEVLEYFDSHWDTSISLEDVKWDKDSPEIRKSAVRVALKGYLTNEVPTIEPRLIEHSWRIELTDCSFDLLGVVDVVEQSGAIRDHKFYARMQNQQNADDEEQLTCYDVARSRGAFGECKSGDLILGVAVKGSERSKSFVTTRTPWQRELFIRDLIKFAKAIDARVFYPRTDGWHCSPNYCDYYKDCRGE